MEQTLDVADLIGREVEVLAADLFGSTVTAVIRKANPNGQALLLEFSPGIRAGSQVCRFAVAQARLECDRLVELLTRGRLGCALTAVPEERFDPLRPFDLSWWRGGGAEIGDVVLR